MFPPSGAGQAGHAMSSTPTSCARPQARPVARYWPPQLRAYPVQASAGPAAMSTAATGATWAQVLQRYDEAQAQHASSSIETNTQLLEDPASGVAFILKIAAKLRDKPKPPAPRCALSARLRPGLLGRS